MPLTAHSVFHTVEGWVAIGTIGLALGTLGVALLTRSTAMATRRLAAETKGLVDATVDLAKVSAEEVELSRRGIEAEVKPLIADWPAGNRKVIVQPGGEEWAILVAVPAVNQNATALIQSVTMHWHETGPPNSESIYQGWPTVLAVGPGGETEARFVFGASDARRIESIEKFWVKIKYTDAAGGQPEITQFDIFWEQTTESWHVYAVSFWRVGADKPYAEARPVNR